MFCNKCGTVVPDDSAFCHKCGYKFAIPLVQTPTPTQTTPQPVIYPTAAPQGAPQQPIAPTPAPQPVAVPQPQVAPQPIQYAPQPAPQPQIIPAPQPIQYAPQPQVTPAPQPVVPQVQQQPVHPQPIAPQPQYQQPTYQPQIPYAPVNNMAYAPKKIFDAKKKAMVTAIFAPVGVGFAFIIFVIFSILYALVLPKLSAPDSVWSIASNVSVLVSFSLGFFISYQIFSIKKKDKAPPLTWAFSFVVFEMLFYVFNTFMLADKEPSTITTITSGFGSIFFATVIGYLATAGFLIQSYSRFDDNGNIIPEKLLRKDGRPLEKNSIIICSLSAPIAVIVSLLFNLIFENLPTLSGFFTISIEYAVCVLISFASLSLFAPKKSFSEFPLSLRLIGVSASFIPLATYFLEDYAIIPDIIIKSTIAFVIMYFTLKSFAAPAKEFQEESLETETPVTTE